MRTLLHLLLLVILSSCFLLISAEETAPKGSSVKIVSIILTGKQVLGAPVIFCCGDRRKCAAISDMCVIVASTDGSVRVVQLGTNKTIWKQRLSSPLRSTPALFFPTDQQQQQQLAIVTSESGVVSCINLETGNFLWQDTQSAAAIKGKSFSPVVDPKTGLVWVPSQNRDLTAYVVAVSGGVPVIAASIKGSDGVWSAPRLSAVSNKIFVALTASTSIIAADIASVTGAGGADVAEKQQQQLTRSWVYDVAPNAQHWKQRLSFWIWTTPTEVCLPKSNKCVIVFGCVDGKVRAVAPATGALLWEGKKRQRSGGVSQPAVQVSGSQFVYVTDSGLVESVEFSGILSGGSSGEVTQRTVLDLKQRVNAPPIPLQIINSDSSSFSPAVIVATQTGRLFVLRIAEDSNSAVFLQHVFAPDCDVVSASSTTGNFIGLGCRNGRAYVMLLSEGIFARAGVEEQKPVVQPRNPVSPPRQQTQAAGVAKELIAKASDEKSDPAMFILGAALLVCVVLFNRLR